MCQSPTARGVNDVWKTQIRAAELLVTESSALDVQMTTAHLKRLVINHQVLIKFQQN